MEAPLRSAPRPTLAASEPRARGRLSLAAVVALLVLVVFVVAWRARSNRFTVEHARPVVSQVDGLPYRVHEDLAGPQRAADTLAILNARVIELMRFLRARYIRGAAGVRHPTRRAAVVRLLARYSPDNLAENSPKDPSGDTSYVEGKGLVVALCLRERGSSASGHDLHDLDTLTFVAFHEMSHLAIDAADHPKMFWAAFRFLLEEAEEAGIYRSPDYARSPVVYCGLDINYNPRWDEGTLPL